MAVKDKPPNNLRVCEGNDHFGLAGFRNHLGRYSICDAYRASIGFTRGAKLQVALLDSLEHGSGAIAHAKLRKNIGDVIFDGSFG